MLREMAGRLRLLITGRRASLLTSGQEAVGRHRPRPVAGRCGKSPLAAAQHPLSARCTPAGRQQPVAIPAKYGGGENGLGTIGASAKFALGDGLPGRFDQRPDERCDPADECPAEQHVKHEDRDLLPVLPTHRDDRGQQVEHEDHGDPHQIIGRTIDPIRHRDQRVTRNEDPVTSPVPKMRFGGAQRQNRCSNPPFRRSALPTLIRPPRRSPSTGRE
jgi:hypothetical protein